MYCELWAIDAGAGVAVFRQEQRWLIVSIDFDWKPKRLKGEVEALRWAVSGSAIPVGVGYNDLSRGVEAVRRVCLIALEDQRPLSLGHVLSLLYDEGGEMPLVLPEESHSRAAGWEIELREFVRFYTKRLDNYFASKNLPPEEVLYLRCETLRRIGESNQSSAEPADLKEWVFGLARRTYLELGGGRRKQKIAKEQEEQQDSQAKDGNLWRLPRRPLETEWSEILRTLQEEDLLCLSAWSQPDTNYSYEEIAIGLGMRAQVVRERVEQAAKAWGRSPSQLRDRALWQASLQQIRKQSL